jgi:hypothetical protein
MRTINIMFYMKHSIYHIKIDQSLNVKMYEEHSRSTPYGGKNIQEVYNVNIRPTCSVVIVMILTSLDLACHFLCAMTARIPKANSWALSGKLVLPAHFLALESLAFSVIDPHFSLLFAKNWLPIKIFCHHGVRIFSPLIIVQSFLCTSNTISLQCCVTACKNYWCTWGTPGVRILTETNHQESGRKIRRDTKLMLLAGDIACRWRCWMELNGGQWKPNLLAVKQYITKGR